MNTRQKGSTTIEFAFVFLMLMMFVLGLLEFSRLLYTWNAANEASRLGARYAVVCADATPIGNDHILAKMQAVMPQITSANLDVAWSPSGCDADLTKPTTPKCEAVTVKLTGLNFQWLAPIPGDFKPALVMPNFSTYLPREMMFYDTNLC